MTSIWSPIPTNSLMVCLSRVTTPSVAGRKVSVMIAIRKRFSLAFPS
jgi:hypothetical protein